MKGGCVRCYVDERPSSARSWDKGFVLRAALHVATGANPENIQQKGCWGEGIEQDASKTTPDPTNRDNSM